MKKVRVQSIPYVPELNHMQRVFELAEKQIVEAISYKRSRGLVEYAETKALERIQEVLNNMVTDSWEYVPTGIEKQYMRGKGITKYVNAVLSTTDLVVIQRLADSLMADITQIANNTMARIQNTWQNAIRIARRENDSYREAVLRVLIQGEATGLGVRQAQDIFLEEMKNKGITAFTDASGRDWSLRAYGEMATRTTGRQATNLGVLMSDENHDLYQISSHRTTCPLCAPYEGRVYSRSGTSEVYPPLTDAFGKIDQLGSNTLDNSWLNIHPNCLHVLIKYFEEGRTKEELKRIRDFSNPANNPYDIDPRSKAEQNRYREREKARSKLLNDYKQYTRYVTILGDQVPRTFQTFLKHKMQGSEKYIAWQKLYREKNKMNKYTVG